MKIKRVLVNHIAAAFLLLLSATALRAQDPASGNIWPEDDEAYEFIGQVKNFPPAGPGLPATSIQYGYLTFVRGLNADQLFALGTPNEKTARFTFFNESVNRSVTVHGSLRVVVREGTTTIYYDQLPLGDRDLNADPAAQFDKFKRGMVVHETTWRHQVVFDTLTGGVTRTELFFVNFWQTITAVNPFLVDGAEVRLGKLGDRIRWMLTGGPDASAQVNGKFAGVAVAEGSKK